METRFVGTGDWSGTLAPSIAGGGGGFRISSGGARLPAAAAGRGSQQWRRAASSPAASADGSRRQRRSASPPAAARRTVSGIHDAFKRSSPRPLSPKPSSLLPHMRQLPGGLLSPSSYGPQFGTALHHAAKKDLCV